MKRRPKCSISNGVKAVGEGANMPLKRAPSSRFLDAGVHSGPAKAANAGGVAVSALEMAQNSARLHWTAEETDAKLGRSWLIFTREALKRLQNTEARKSARRLQYSRIYQSGGCDDRSGSRLTVKRESMMPSLFLCFIIVSAPTDKGVYSRNGNSRVADAESERRSGEHPAVRIIGIWPVC